MKNAVLGALVGAGLVALVVGGQGPVREAFGRPAVGEFGSGEGLIALATDLDNLRGQLTLIDPVKQVMAVYHVDRASGKVELKSVRNFTWDLQMLEWNAVTPLPGEIRASLQQP